mmetsp:Transcript_8171/g.19717  ORF Transcript_8171/g.19717 Transcript_8171/m.19717 type:complete len:407 (+) Transcript_8171:209-1429(+)
MSGKYPSPPPLATSETLGSESGFQVEFRDGYYYIAAVPPGCKDLKVGDRVLEINGVQAFNFGSAKKANELFDTVCMVFLPKEELIRKANGKKKYHDDDSTSSEEEVVNRRGRRSMYEEEARRIGAERMSSRNLGETLRKKKEEEAELRKIEREIRQLERADRERRADQERRRSIVTNLSLPNGALATTNGQRPSILFSPPQTSNKSVLRSSIMESIQKSPSTSDRKVRSSIIESAKKSPSTSDRKKSKIRSSISPPAAPMTSEQPKKTKESSSKSKEPKTKEKKSARVSPAPSKTEVSRKSKSRSTSPIPITEVPKKSKPRSSSPNPNSGAPKIPKRRSSVMVEKKVRELEQAAQQRNGGRPLSPEETLKPKIKSSKLDRKLGKGGSKKGSNKLSSSSSSQKSNGS